MRGGRGSKKCLAREEDKNLNASSNVILEQNIIKKGFYFEKITNY